MHNKGDRLTVRSREHLGRIEKELCDLQTETRGCCSTGQDNGRLPGPTGRVLVPKRSKCSFPFFRLFPLLQTGRPRGEMNGRTQIPSSPSPWRKLQKKPSAYIATIKLDAIVPSMRISLPFSPPVTFRNTSHPLPRVRSLRRATWPR